MWLQKLRNSILVPAWQPRTNWAWALLYKYTCLRVNQTNKIKRTYLPSSINWNYQKACLDIVFSSWFISGVVIICDNRKRMLQSSKMQLIKMHGKSEKNWIQFSFVFSLWFWKIIGAMLRSHLVGRLSCERESTPRRCAVSWQRWSHSNREGRRAKGRAFLITGRQRQEGGKGNRDGGWC